MNALGLRAALSNSKTSSSKRAVHSFFISSHPLDEGVCNETNPSRFSQDVVHTIGFRRGYDFEYSSAGARSRNR